MHHRQREDCTSPSISIGLRLRDMRGAPELKLIRALADAQARRVPGLVGAGVKRAEPDLDAAERRRCVPLGDLDRQRVLGPCRRRDAEPRLGASPRAHRVFARPPLSPARAHRASVQSSASVPGERLVARALPGRDHDLARRCRAPRPLRPPARPSRRALIGKLCRPPTTGIGTSHTARLRMIWLFCHDHALTNSAARRAGRRCGRTPGSGPSPCWAKPPCDSPAQ